MHAPGVGRRRRPVGWPGRRLLGAALAAAAVGWLGAGCGTSSTATSSTAPPAPAGLTAPHPIVTGGAGLFVTDGCSACHSLGGTPGIGPSLAGISGQELTLADGHRVLATGAFLREALLRPASVPIKGYAPDLMAVAVARLRLAMHRADVNALVAFIESTQ